MSTPEPPGVPDPWQPPVEGAVPPPPPPPPPGGQEWGTPPTTARTSGRAIAVMVLGIVGLVMTCGWGLGIVLAVIALALAPGAKREIAASGGTITGGGMIKAGVICSWITVALVAIGIIFVVALVIFGGGDPNSVGGTERIAESGVGLVGLAASLPVLTPALRRLRASVA